MDWNFVKEGIDAVIIDNFYSESQLKEIFQQLETITPSMIADKDKLEAAVDLDGNYITAKYGTWVTDPQSALVRIPVEMFSKKEMMDKFVEFNSMYRMLFHMNRRSHLVSYYENTGYYSKHVDSSVFTILNYFYKEPKSFEGGEIVLHSHDMAKKVVVEPRNNRVIVVPSCTVHEVMPVQMTSHKLDGTGRYCCSIFAAIEYLKERT